MDYDQNKNISLLFIIFFFSAGVLLFVGLLAFDTKTILKGALLCHVYAPVVYCLPDEINSSIQRIFRKRINLKSSLCIIGIIICFYQLFSFNPPVRYLGSF